LTQAKLSRPRPWPQHSRHASDCVPEAEGEAVGAAAAAGENSRCAEFGPHLHCACCNALGCERADCPQFSCVGSCKRRAACPDGNGQLVVGADAGSFMSCCSSMGGVVSFAVCVTSFGSCRLEPMR